MLISIVSNHQEKHLINRRQFIQTSSIVGAAALPGLGLAQNKAAEYRFKLGTDLPVSHSVNVRLKEAIAAIEAWCKKRKNMKLTQKPRHIISVDVNVLAAHQPDDLVHREWCRVQ